MDKRIREWLQDILDQAHEIRDFTAGIVFETYQADHKTQAAVERKFEIIGEALNRIRAANEELLEDIRDSRSIISFRNILAHGYDSIEERIVWGIIESDLHNLITDVEKLLG
ncbi:MAG: DUF86 domain-containing protein [Verrucomicrobia bacterium]|jgi:uncharacterized protein with HEPN domain|nr:DUF86 domain-containing protein [Verrucomicrobiota bacterium]